MSKLNKPELRKLLRERRKALPGQLRQQASEAIAHHATTLPGWNTARHIALYLAADGEIDPASLAQLARKAGIAVYLPAIPESGATMHFARWNAESELVVNRYGIPEPGPGAGTGTAEDMDIVFTPLVGWNENGSRLGMGGGFYDRALAAASTLLVGLGFECQKVEAIPLEDWDIPLDFVATETTLYNCRLAKG